MGAAPRPMVTGASRGTIEFLQAPPAPIESYSVISTIGPTLIKTETDTKSPYKLSITGNDTLRLERTKPGTDRLVVALTSIKALAFSAENRLIIIVGG